MDPVQIDGALKFAHEHSWVVLSSIIVWGLVRVSKDDRAVKWFPVEIAPLWRSWAALILGMAAAVIHKLWTHGPWPEVVPGGFSIGVLATYGHEIVIESLRKGRDIGVKKDDAPPPPPPKPPISIKPPSPTINVIGQMLGLSIFLAGAVMLVLVTIELVSCKVPAVPIDDVGPLVMNAGACRAKGMAIIADGGTCDEKRERLGELVRTDPDCIGLYADAGPVLHCKGDER